MPKRVIRKGRRLYGAVYTLPSGVEVYLAYRKHSEYFRSGKKTLSEAVNDNVAAWALDDETLIRLRIEGVRYAGVLVREDDDVYIAPISSFFDKTQAKVMNYESRGGALQRYLPLDRFKRLTGSQAVR